MATLNDVALKAGVGRTTVSRVLNGDPAVKASTREKVLRVINELKYSPNIIAKSLVEGQSALSDLLAARHLTVAFRDGNQGHRFWFTSLRELTKAAQEQGLGVSVLYLSHDADPNEMVRRNNGIPACGVICCGFDLGMVSALVKMDVPVVLFDYSPCGYPGHAVVPDYRGGAYLATKHLIGLGHRRIAQIAGDHPEKTCAFSNLVLLGYQDALREAGLPIKEEYMPTGDYTAMRAFDLAQQLFGLPEPPTAIFASNDEAAVGVYRAAQQFGLNIPADLSVVSVDNLDISTEMSPPLTTVDIPIARMARISVDRLIKLTKKREIEPGTLLLPATLVVRQSCAAYNGKRS